MAGGINYNHKAKLFQLHFSLFQKNPVIQRVIIVEDFRSDDHAGMVINDHNDIGSV